MWGRESEINVTAVTVPDPEADEGGRMLGYLSSPCYSQQVSVCVLATVVGVGGVTVRAHAYDVGFSCPAHGSHFTTNFPCVGISVVQSM